MITAAKPKFPTENDLGDDHSRMAAMSQELAAKGIEHEQTMGKYGDPEPTFLTYGMPKHELMAMGKKYGQESVYHHENGARHMIFTNGPDEGMYHDTKPGHQEWTEEQGPPADNYTHIPGRGYVSFTPDFSRLHPVEHPVTKHEIGWAIFCMLKRVLND